MTPQKSTSAPEPNRWQKPLILRQAERLALRTGGIFLAGYTFYSFPEETIPHRELRFIVGVMGGCAPVATFLALAVSSTDVHLGRLADRLRAETPSSTRVALIFCKGDQRIPADEGILTFEGGVLCYVGTKAAFRLGRSHIHAVYRGAGDRLELMFLDGNEPHRIAFDEKGKGPKDLANILRIWMEQAPADAKFEPPPYAPPPSPRLARLKAFAPWIVGFALVRLQLHLLPANSSQRLSLVITFLLLLAVVTAITFIQSALVSNRANRDPLSNLLNRARVRVFSEDRATKPHTDDVPSHQTIAR